MARVSGDRYDDVAREILRALGGFDAAAPSHREKLKDVVAILRVRFKLNRATGEAARVPGDGLLDACPACGTRPRMRVLSARGVECAADPARNVHVPEALPFGMVESRTPHVHMRGSGTKGKQERVLCTGPLVVPGSKRPWREGKKNEE